MQKPALALVLLCTVLFCGAIQNEERYQTYLGKLTGTKPIHEQSVKDAAALVEKVLQPSSDELNNFVQGVAAPDIDVPFFDKAQVALIGAKQYISTHFKQKMLATRTATQHLHSLALPLKDVGHHAQGVIIPEGYDPGDKNAKHTLFSYASNKQTHNKILESLTNWIWVAMLHPDDTQSQLKLGHIMHTIGDSFAAGHSQRQDPAGKDQEHFTDVDCSTAFIRVFHSMDTSNWLNHATADVVVGDWRYYCAKQTIADLIRFYKTNRPKMKAIKDAKEQSDQINKISEDFGKWLCTKALPINSTVLEFPSGGNTVPFSQYTKTPLSKKIQAAEEKVLKFFKLNHVVHFKGDRPVLPMGLTSEEDSVELMREIAHEVHKQDTANVNHAKVHTFSFPKRSDPWVCADTSYAAFHISPKFLELITSAKTPTDYWVDLQSIVAPIPKPLRSGHDAEIAYSAGRDSAISFNRAKELWFKLVDGVKQVFHSNV